jgi:hypothetical protein
MTQQDAGSEPGPVVDITHLPVLPSTTPLTTEVPACSVCGRQDETLRIVIYPFVFSLIIVTFRRAFAGLWCRVHRNQRLALASLITATLGWIGIPFGLLWTPMTLFKLAQGGEQPAELNVNILKTLAERKLQEGDAKGAVRCLEASLQFGDDETTRKRLRELQIRFALPAYESGWQRIVFTLASAMLGAVLIGAVVGVLDYIIRAALSSWLGDMEVSIYAAILSWTPFAAMAFIGGLALSQLIEWALARINCRRLALAISIAIFIAVLSAYGILHGSAISDYVATLLTGGVFESSLEAAGYGVIVILMGGVFGLLDLPEATNTYEVIYLVLLSASAVYYLVLAILTAVRTTRWQQLLAVEDTTGDLAQPEQTTKYPVAKREWLLGCAVMLLVLCLFAGVLVGGFSLWDTVSSRTSLVVNVSCPAQVHQGDTIEAIVALNSVEAKAITVTDISIDSSLELNFMDGIEVKGTRPPYIRYEESDGYHYYFFDMTIEPAQSQAFSFELRAKNPGKFKGLVFVDIMKDGSNLHTRPISVEVVVLP